MHTLSLYGLRGLAGGGLVVVLALVGEVLSPKAFAGLFAAAPSVAVASLAITVVSAGTVKAHQASVGMVIGSIAMTACCVVAVTAIPRLGAVHGSVLVWLGWAAVAMGLYWAVFIGAR